MQLKPTPILLKATYIKGILSSWGIEYMGEGVFSKHCTVYENIFDAFHIHEIMYILRILIWD